MEKKKIIFIILIIIVAIVCISVIFIGKHSDNIKKEQITKSNKNTKIKPEEQKNTTENSPNKSEKEVFDSKLPLILENGYGTKINEGDTDLTNFYEMYSFTDDGKTGFYQRFDKKGGIEIFGEPFFYFVNQAENEISISMNSGGERDYPFEIINKRKIKIGKYIYKMD